MGGANTVAQTAAGTASTDKGCVVGHMLFEEMMQAIAAID